MHEEEILECADCGAFLADGEAEHKNDSGDPICESCAGGYVTCADCGDTISADSECRNEQGEPICDSCGDNYSTCGNCGAVVHEDNGAWIEGEDVLVCDTCLEQRYCPCEDCGRYVSDDRAYALGSGGRICHRCYENNDYSRCSDFQHNAPP